MNRRTIFLLVGAIAVGLLWGVDQLYRQWYEAPKSQLENKLDALSKSMVKARRAEVAGKAKSRELEPLVQYSLPYDAELARSAYQDWLLQLVKSHGMENASVDAGSPRAVRVKGRVRNGDRTVAQRINFGLRSKTDLKQLTAFLYDFYQAGHLHKITNLTMTPLSNGRAIDLNLSIETLALEICERESELSEVNWSRLQESDLLAYKSLGRRNIFARGVSKSLGTVTLSGVTYNRSGLAEAWFSVGAERRTQIVKQGNLVLVDLVEIEVLEIEQRRVQLDMNGELIWLEVGESIGEVLGKKDPNFANVR